MARKTLVPGRARVGARLAEPIGMFKTVMNPKGLMACIRGAAAVEYLTTVGGALVVGYGLYHFTTQGNALSAGGRHRAWWSRRCKTSWGSVGGNVEHSGHAR